MCGNATHPYMTVELMENYIMGLECAVQAQELIVICMQQQYEKQINKQKVRNFFGFNCVFKHF